MKLINLGSHTPQDVPNIRFRPSLIDHVLEGIAFLPVLAHWIYIFYHYRLSGGDVPSDLYQSGGMTLFIFFLLFAVGYCPVRFINFPFRVGRHNVVYQYVLSLRLCRVLNIVLSTQFLFGALSTHHAWAKAGFAVCVVLLLVAFAVYMVLAWRRR